MTLFNKLGRELDKKLDGWRGTIPLISVYILAGIMLFGGIILFNAWYQGYL